MNFYTYKTFLLCDDRHENNHAVICYRIINGNTRFYISPTQSKLKAEDFFYEYYNTDKSFILLDMVLYCHDYDIRVGEEYYIADCLSVLRLQDTIDEE